MQAAWEIGGKNTWREETTFDSSYREANERKGSKTWDSILATCHIPNETEIEM